MQMKFLAVRCASLHFPTESQYRAPERLFRKSQCKAPGCLFRQSQCKAPGRLFRKSQCKAPGCLFLKVAWQSARTHFVGKVGFHLSRKPPECDWSEFLTLFSINCKKIVTVVSSFAFHQLQEDCNNVVKLCISSLARRSPQCCQNLLFNQSQEDCNNVIRFCLSSTAKRSSQCCQILPLSHCKKIVTTLSNHFSPESWTEKDT